MGEWIKLGIVAGGGALPVVLAEHCRRSGQAYFVARISPFAHCDLEGHPSAAHGLGQMGARIEALRAAGCDALTFIGKIPRPDLARLEWDEAGRAMLPALAAAAPLGDDALLRAVLESHALAGFAVIGADQAMAELLAPAGALGAIAPNAAQRADIAKAAHIAAAIGGLDIGQGAVVCDGLVLAVEAQEGTDAMLARVADLAPELRARGGVLAKRPKPMQERRVDLPVIGLRTLEGAQRAGLAGIAVEAGAALIVDRAGLVAAADAAGLFLYGFAANEFA